ncbi:MAG: hypothetical protein AAF800_08510 [Planctomycetota bacterium]
MESLLGWSASTLLLLTIAYQSWRQYLRLREAGDTGGASPWLFLGQTVANALFVAYALLLGNIVFTVTNTGLLLASLFGLWVCVRQHGSAKQTAQAAADEVKAS